MQLSMHKSVQYDSVKGEIEVALYAALEVALNVPLEVAVKGALEVALDLRLYCACWCTH